MAEDRGKTHLNQASPLQSANLLHKRATASAALSVTHAPSTVTCKSGAVRFLGLNKKKGWETCVIVRVRRPSTTKRPSFVVLCGGFRRPAQHNRVCNCFSALWLPSFCCSPLAGRCGTMRGLRFFAGSPCQLAVVTTMGG